MDVDRHRIEFYERLRRRDKRVDALVYVLGFLLGIVLIPVVFVICIFYVPHHFGKIISEKNKRARS